MRTIKFILTLLVSIFIGQQTVFALGVDELLLDRLVKKGVITPEDAAGIRAEAAVKAQEELKAKKRFNVEGKTRIDLSGYLHFQYAADEATGKFDGFKIRRVRLDFRGDVSKDIGWRTQLDAVQPLKNVVEKVTQKDAATVTTTTTKAVTRPVLLDAYLDYKPYSFANFRIGQFKLPFGQENLESSPKRDIINRSQVTERLVPGRDIGGQVSGEFDFGTKKKIEYAVGIFNGAGINVDDDNECKDIAGRILIFPIQDLSVGVSYYNGKSGAAETDKLRTGMELSYLINRLSIEGEYISGKDGNLEEYGWYAQIGYKFVPELEAVVKYDSYEPDKNKTDDKIDAATLGLNWVLNKWAKIQTNYEWKFEEGTKVSNDVFLTQYQVQF